MRPVAQQEPPLDEELTDTNGSLDVLKTNQMLERIFSRSNIFENQLGEAPAVISCPNCDHPANKDIEESWRQKRVVHICNNCAENTRQQKIGAAIERAGIPTDVREATIENFAVNRPGVVTGTGFQTPEQFRSAAIRFKEKGKRNLILGGTVGIGKGHLAAALAIHFISQGWKVAWIECSRLFRDYHAAYKTNSNEEMADRLGTVGLLVLDEICLRDMPADGEEILFSILDRRHKDSKPTILLSNKPAIEVKKWLGDRITDRLRSGGVIFAYGEWQSMRGTTADGATQEEGF